MKVIDRGRTSFSAASSRPLLPVRVQRIRLAGSAAGIDEAADDPVSPTVVLQPVGGVDVEQGSVPAQADITTGVDVLPTVAIGGALILGLLAVAAFVIRDRARTG